MIETIMDKLVGKFCTVEITNGCDGLFVVRGFWKDCIDYNMECFETFEEALKFYNYLDSVKKCKIFYGRKVC